MSKYCNFTSYNVKDNLYLTTIFIFSETCLALALHNGKVMYDMNMVNGQYPVYTIATFQCGYGYNQSGPSSATCRYSGKWSQDTPTCYQSNERYFTLIPTNECFPLFEVTQSDIV